MKYVVLIPDGCADVALDELGGCTPLEAARMPRLDALAARAEVGRASVILDGLPPGSDVGNMAILGFDPNNLAALALYTSMGFRAACYFVNARKEL